MPSPKQLAKALARQDSVTQQPRNRFLGAIADAAGYVSDQADRYVVPERDPLFGGMRGGDLLPLRNVNRLLDDLSYGGRITTGRGQTTTLRPEVVDLAGVTGAMMPAAKGLSKAALREGARQIETGTGIGRAALNPRMSAVPEGASMPQRPKTEFEILHETAQRNAALPVEQGGLGLPANNTYIDRANAPGMFPTDAYTGTNQDIRSLDPSKAKFAREGSGSWASENPEFANSYAGRPDGNVMPLRINTSKFGELDALNSNWNKIPSREPIRHADGTDSSMSEYIQSVFDDFGNTNLASNIARKMGDKGLIVNNVKDYGGYVGGAGDVPEFATNFAIHDPSQVRSRFAAFDPMRRHEADILAGVGVGGMLDPQAIAEALRQQDRK
jgi:hypothetical protein